MEKTFETPGGVRLSVEIQAGLVVVTASATDRTVVSVGADTPGAEELVERATVECEPTGGRHHVMVKMPHVYGMRLLRRNAVTVRVDVPEGAMSSVATASADIEINGPVGEVDVKTASGDVSIDDVAADVDAKTASGNITVGNVGGDIRAYTASGDLRCSSVAGAAKFSTTSGDLEVGAAGNRVEVKATSGDVRLGELAAGARVVNVSGNVVSSHWRRARCTCAPSRVTCGSASPRGSTCTLTWRRPRAWCTRRSPSTMRRRGRAPRPGWTSACAASRATSRSGGRSSTSPDALLYPKTIGKASRFSIMSATGTRGTTSTVFHCDRPVAWTSSVTASMLGASTTDTCDARGRSGAGR